MPFSINAFRANLKFGGLRQNLFEVIVSNPVVANADGVLPFRCMAANLPGVNINEKQVFYFGRPIKLPGNQTFQPWQTVVVEDEDFAVYDALQAWATSINNLEGNLNSLPSSEPVLYKSLGRIRMFSQTGEVIREIEMDGMWPQQVSPIEAAWERDEIATFSVTWAYDYWRPITATSQVEV